MDHINLTGYPAAQRLQIERYLATLQPAGIHSLAAPPSQIQVCASADSQAHVPSSQISQYHSIHLQAAEGSLSTARPPLSTRVPSNIPAPSQHIISQPASSGFLGFQQMRRQVNQQRLESSSHSGGQTGRSHTLSQSHALQPRTSRRPPRSIRGVAVQPPSLPSLRGIHRVYQYDDVGRRTGITIRAKVYPPIMRDLDAGSGGPFVYRFYRESFNAALERAGLLFDREFPLDMSVSDVIGHIQLAMESGLHAHLFSSRRLGYTQDVSLILPHEALPLTLLGLVNRGRTRADGHVRLTPRPSQSMTLELLANNANYYANEMLCIEGSRLVIHLLAVRGPLSGILDPGSVDRAKRIDCLSTWLYNQFPHDNLAQSLETLVDPEEPPLVQSIPSTSAPAHSESTLTQVRLQEQLAQTTGNQRVQPGRAVVDLRASRRANPYALPRQLWETSPWAHRRSSNFISLEDRIDAAIWDEAGDGLDNIPSLNLSGISTEQLAQKLLAEVKDAAENHDFTKVMSKDREFNVIRLVRGNRREIVSLGRGVELETVHLAFEQFKKNHSSWFLPRACEYSSIAISQSLSPTSVPQSRLTNLTILGALTGLMVIYGVAPAPFGPAFLQFLLHDCDLRSLTSEFVQEWYPELHRVLQDWVDLDPSDNNLSSFRSHFATYHDAEIAAFYNRTTESHNAIGVEMLYRAVIGPVLPSHPEMEAFIEGFRLDTDSGFSMLQLRELIQGGTVALLNQVWTSQIKCSADIVRFSETPAHLDAALTHVDTTYTIPYLFERFLQGKGIPSHSHFEEIQQHFSGHVDLSHIENESFRPRVFCWALTGSPALDFGSDGLNIKLCHFDDPQYLPTATDTAQRAMANEGKIAFRTCPKQALVPIDFIKKLLQQPYPTVTRNTTPFLSFEQAFNHWLLSELICSIGTHTIL